LLINGSLEALVALDAGKSFDLKRCSSFRTPSPSHPGSDPKTAPAAPLAVGELPAQPWLPRTGIYGSGSAAAYFSFPFLRED